MRVEQQETTKKEEKFVAPQPMGKVMLLAGSVVAATLIFWLAWHNAITSVSFDLGAKNIITIISTLLAFSLMFAVLALAELLITKKLILLAMVIVSAGTAFIFFPPNLWTFIGFLLMLLGFLYWRREISIDLESRIKFIPQKSIKNGLRGVVMLVLLAASFMYYGFLTDQKETGTEFLDGIVDSSMGVANLAIEQFYGESYDPNMTLDEFTFNLLVKELPAIQDLEGMENQSEIEGLGYKFEDLDKIINEGLLDIEKGALEQGRNQFLDNFGIKATGDERMEDVLRKIVVKNLTKYVEPYQQFVPALLAISLFFAMNIFGFIYREMVKSMSFLLFHILQWVHFIEIKKIKVDAEKVTL